MVNLMYADERASYRSGHGIDFAFNGSGRNMMVSQPFTYS